jgi:hypothetical protein
MASPFLWLRRFYGFAVLKVELKACRAVCLLAFQPSQHFFGRLLASKMFVLLGKWAMTSIVKIADK